LVVVVVSMYVFSNTSAHAPVFFLSHWSAYYSQSACWKQCIDLIENCFIACLYIAGYRKKNSVGESSLALPNIAVALFLK
jgi:hypothetical protein